MKESPRIAVVCGGVSQERSVSIGSGKASARGLAQHFKVDFVELSEEALPPILAPERHVVFSTLHGSFGEDGGFQEMLDEAGFEYAGCDRASSALTFDKARTKDALAVAGVPVAAQIEFDRSAVPDPQSVLDRLGPAVALKPICQGSSIGLSFATNLRELEEALSDLPFERWMIEPLIVGKEVSVGVLEGEPLEIVEIRPKSGKFDYESKYTSGLTDYIVPAPLSKDLEKKVKSIAADAFLACGCRDYGRVDFMIDEEDNPFVLELNTLPGMKDTSLLPMSAGACGINFESLLKKLVAPAIMRFQNRYSIC